MSTPQPPPAEVTVDDHPDNSTTSLLYIEDNDPNVHVVEHLIKLRPRWRMIHAGLGGLGIELARAHQPQLILLDLHLPDQNGHDVLHTLKRRPDTKNIPVVILNADASPGLTNRLIDAGAELFITKPIEVDVVLALFDDISQRSDNTHPPRGGETR